MPMSSKNKIIAVFAALLIVVAVALAVLLFTDKDSEEPANETTTEETTTQSTTAPSSGLVAVVKSKYLWQYGWQQIASERPSEIPTTQEESSTDEETTIYVPETYFESVTNWKGENVTDENGEAVTEVRTHPRTEVYIETVTDENGEAVTDENGEAVTEVYSEIVTTTLPPVYATDENGEAITDEEGSAVTETTTEEKTTAIVGGIGNSESKYWAQGVSDGEKYVRMKIYIDGEYDVKSSSVMSLTLREKTGLINLPDTLVYNLSKGTCSIGTKKYSEMAYVTKSAGQTVVTLIIPEEARPNVADTTSFSAKSTISTFNDGNGNYLDEFTVSVNLS